QPEETNPEVIKLNKAESHHLISVNRAQKGDPVIAFNGSGIEWECLCQEAHRTTAILKVLAQRQIPRFPFSITLAQALPKGKAMDIIIRKATEIGAAHILPLQSDRTEVHLQKDRKSSKLEKWQTTAIEAAKQCGNPFLPEIHPIQSVSNLLISTGNAYDLKLIGSLYPEATSLKKILSQHQSSHQKSPANVIWMIGPEGDFSPDEMEQAIQAGFKPITMGPLVLRSETAATYALSILSYELLNS
ncbi:MAG: 16S rRNA (uracil(1498)-N(3))-methyltransferase, partial [Opitutaceae bacterium]|nr:16S rRNA (uracil(1498)-N(3))-methyltransferase [Opitutaceae bacterium]